MLQNFGIQNQPELESNLWQRTDVPNANYNVNCVLGWVGFDVEILIKGVLK